MTDSGANLRWLLDEFASRLASVFETMAGERPSIVHAPGPPSASGQPGAGLYWRQPFTGVPGELFVAAPDSVWTFAAEQILRAAGMEDADRETLESTYLEAIGQALGGVAQAMSARLGKEITPAGGQKTSELPNDARWSAFDFTFAAGAVTIHAGPQTSLVDALTPASQEAPGVEDGVEHAAEASDASSPSKTFDLLLDVELPVSVSFGRASVQLKDVLKLTSGSIVELNRSIVEPVEVIVNNCVIARGEVVVVEGNFGVRIQQVVSRQERLRTLN